MTTLVVWYLALVTALGSAYRAINAADDAMEDRIAKWPGMAWFHFNTTGHPISWLQHGLFALSARGYGEMIGQADLVSRFVFWAYVARELWGCWEKWRELGFWPAAFVDRVDRTPRPENGFVIQAGLYVGWLVDALGDIVGPGLLWWPLP